MSNFPPTIKYLAKKVGESKTAQEALDILEEGTSHPRWDKSGIDWRATHRIFRRMLDMEPLNDKDSFQRLDRAFGMLIIPRKDLIEGVSDSYKTGIRHFLTHEIEFGKENMPWTSSFIAYGVHGRWRVRRFFVDVYNHWLERGSHPRAELKLIRVLTRNAGNQLVGDPSPSKKRYVADIAKELEILANKNPNATKIAAKMARTIGIHNHSDWITVKEKYEINSPTVELLLKKAWLTEAQKINRSRLVEAPKPRM